MTTTTRRKILHDNYNQLIVNIRKHTNEIIFPSLEDMDLIELIFYFNHFFGSIEEPDYKRTIMDIMNVKNIILDEKTFEMVYPFIFDFLVFFKLLK